jgi:peptide subunit release factor 1 (eRF1)
MVPKESDNARFRYKCPECGHKENGEKEWKRPFSLKCAGCGHLMRLARLKDEAKKEKKKARQSA